MQAQVKVHNSLEEISRAAADLLLRCAEKAIAARGQFTLALSGGSTPKKLFETLSSEPWVSKFPWRSSHLFWGDERFVPLDDPESNYGMTRAALLEKVPLPEGQVHPLALGSATVEEAARLYENELASVFNITANDINSASKGNFPRFDMVLLGVGGDGHTASLFPGSEALNEAKRWALAVEAPEIYPTRERVSLTLPLLNSGRCIVFLAAGSGKKPVLDKIFNDPAQAEKIYPAARIKPRDGELFWLIDAEAVP